MITGKAYSRSLRGHYLVESALTSILIDTILGGDTNTVMNADDIRDLKDLYVNAVNHQFHLFETDIPATLQKLDVELNNIKMKLAGTNRTAKLWVQYLSHIGLVKTFIQAERTCNWDLHLNTVSKMLDVIAAAGHTHYTKSCRVYLQQMLELREKNEWLHS
jgi:hypothetical protein